MLCTFFSGERVVDYASAKRSDTNRYALFFRAMLANGVYLAPSQFEAGFLSLRPQRTGHRAHRPGGGGGVREG